MIRFRCRECDRTFERPNEAAGSLVFCTCGTGNRVPWQSTLPDPDPTAEPVTQEATEPPLRMLLPEEEASPVPRYQDQRRPAWRPVLQRDPHFCFNHQTVAAQQTCDGCKEVFCPACLVSLQGQILCGPCKNFHLRTLQKPPRLSVLAVIALTLGLVTAPVGMFCLSFASASMKAPGLGYGGLLFPLVTLVLGCLALREIETDPRVGGRSIAMASVVTSLVSGYLIVIMVELMGRQVE